MSSRRLFVAAAILYAAALSSCSKDKGTNSTGVAKELNSGNIAQHATFAHRFFSPGNFSYHCANHSSMAHALVSVDAEAPAGDTAKTVDIASFAFTPGSVTIAPGGKVTWTNHDSPPHTVTSD